MNKIMFYKELIGAFQAISDPKIIKAAGQAIAESEALSAERRAEMEAALKTIADAEAAIAKLQKKEDKLSHLIELKAQLEKQKEHLEEDNKLFSLAVAQHEDKKLALSNDLKGFAEKERALIKQKADADAQVKKLDKKEAELLERESLIKAREDKHKSFIESIG